MRSYLVSYFYQGGQGQSFIDTTSDEAPSRDLIEEWERLIAADNGVQNVGVTNFVEISKSAQQESADNEYWFIRETAWV